MENSKQPPAVIPSKGEDRNRLEIIYLIAPIVLPVVALVLALQEFYQHRLTGSEWDQMARVTAQDREPATAEQLSEASRQSPCITSRLQHSISEQIVITKGALRTFRFDCSNAAKNENLLTQQKSALGN
jgi:hypothetical protein